MPFARWSLPWGNSGDVQVDNNFVEVDNILFDSGAMQTSYMSEHWMDEHRAQIQPRLRACRGRIRLADNQTVGDISERFRTLASFTLRGSGEVITGIVDF